MPPDDDSIERFLAKVRFKADADLPDELNARCDFMETAMDIWADYELKEWMQPSDAPPAFRDLKGHQLLLLDLWEARQEALGKFLHAAEQFARREQKAFAQLCTLLDPLVGQHPGDPRLQRWVKLRDAWAKELPPAP